MNVFFFGGGEAKNKKGALAYNESNEIYVEE